MLLNGSIFHGIRREAHGGGQKPPTFCQGKRERAQTMTNGTKEPNAPLAAAVYIYQGGTCVYQDLDGTNTSRAFENVQCLIKYLESIEDEDEGEDF